jgi:hypothetical protein
MGREWPVKALPEGAQCGLRALIVPIPASDRRGTASLDLRVLLRQITSLKRPVSWLRPILPNGEKVDDSARLAPGRAAERDKPPPPVCGTGAEGTKDGLSPTPGLLGFLVSTQLRGCRFRQRLLTTTKATMRGIQKRKRPQPSESTLGLSFDSVGAPGFKPGTEPGQYIPSMPPPIPPPAPAGAFSSFRSTTTHSVVSSNPAIDAAFWSAVRLTLVGSITPAFTRSS